jgi:hypothetical protein
MCIVYFFLAGGLLALLITVLIMPNPDETSGAIERVKPKKRR